MSTSDPATIRFYESEGGIYSVRAYEKQEPPRLAAFAKLLPKGGTVLDLGCGAGQDAASFQRRGFTVAAVDASARMAAEARERTGLHVSVLSFDELEYSSEFDGIWASASLHHAPFSAQSMIFDRLHLALKPGAHLYASYKQGKVDRRDRFGRLYCEMDEKQLRALVGDASRWREVNIERAKGSGYDNEPTDWLILTARHI